MDIAIVVSGTACDMVQASALIETVLTANPEGKITVFGPCEAMDVAEGMPPGPDYLYPRCLNVRPKWPGGIRLWWLLRRRRFDQVYVCSRRAYVRIAVYMTGIARRVGLAGGKTTFLLSDRRHVTDHENQVVAMAALARLMGAPAITQHEHYTPRSESAVKMKEEVTAIDSQGGDGPLVAIAPGGVPTWPGERFAHLANQLRTRHAARVVIIGGEDDRETTDAMLLDVSEDVTDFCGKLSWDENAALLAQCDLCVSSDPLVLHLAAGVGCATLGLFGKGTAARLTPPGPLNRSIESVSDDLGTIRIDDALSCIEVG